MSDQTTVIIVRQETPVTVTQTTSPPVTATVTAAPQVIATPDPSPDVIISECPQQSFDFPFVPPIAFSFGDAPGIVWTAPVAGTFTNSRLDITTAFNGTAPTIKVGVIGSTEALMTAEQSDPTEQARWDAASDYAVTAGMGIWLEISVSGATQGAGTLYVEFVPND